MVGIATGQAKFAASNGGSNQECPRFNAIGMDTVFCTMQSFRALHAYRRRAGAFNPRSHGDQHFC
jgi:hypothetical protein